MRTIGRIFILAALAATAATALAGPTVATAEETTLCQEDAAECAKPTTSVHLTSVGKAKLLASPRIECNVLFSSTSVGSSGSPQIIQGHYTYTNCGCTFREVAGTTATIEVLKEGHETARVTGEDEIEVSCFGMECIYNGEGVEATAKGPLLSKQANGEVMLLEQVVHWEGAFCLAKVKLDIDFEPLSATYIM